MSAAGFDDEDGADEDSFFPPGRTGSGRRVAVGGGIASVVGYER